LPQGVGEGFGELPGNGGGAPVAGGFGAPEASDHGPEGGGSGGGD